LRRFPQQKGITILLSDHQVPKAPISAERVSLRVSGAPGARSAWLERIDDEHVNPRRAWVDMGIPTCQNRYQIQELMKALKLRREKIDATGDESGVSIDLLIQPHSVASVSLE
jgi:hypothetical protein